MSSSNDNAVSERRRPALFRLLRAVVGAVIVVAFAWYLWDQRAKLATALEATVWHFSSLCVLIAVSWLLNGAQAHVIYRAVSIPVSVWEGTMLSVAGSFGNHLPMRAGTVLRALYLKTVHGLRFARFGGISGLRMLLTVIAAGTMGCAALIVISLQGVATAPLELTLIFLALVVVPLVLLRVPFSRIRFVPSRLQKIVHDFADAYNELRRQPKVAFYVVLLLLAQYGVLSLRFIVSADAVGAEIAPAFLLLMAPLAALMSFIAITPGGLGLREGVMGFVTMSIGFSFSDGIFVGTVDRAVLLLMTALLGGISFWLLWRRCK